MNRFLPYDVFGPVFVGFLLGVALIAYWGADLGAREALQDGVQAIEAAS